MISSFPWKIWETPSTHIGVVGETAMGTWATWTHRTLISTMCGQAAHAPQQAQPHVAEVGVEAWGGRTPICCQAALQDLLQHHCLVESCLPHLISGLCKTTSNWCSGFLGFSLNELVFFFFKDTYFYLFIGPHQILIAACKLLVVACGSGSLTRNRTWAPLYWEHRVSGTGQQGSPLVYFCWVLCSGNLSLSSGCLCVCVCVCVYSCA